VLPHLSEVQSCGAFHVESHVSGDEVCSLGYTVSDYHDCVIVMSTRKLNNEVDDVPLVFCSLCRVGDVATWSDCKGRMFLHRVQCIL
jgi:hypothetical protein